RETVTVVVDGPTIPPEPEVDPVFDEPPDPLRGANALGFVVVPPASTAVADAVVVVAVIMVEIFHIPYIDDDDDGHGSAADESVDVAVADVAVHDDDVDDVDDGTLVGTANKLVKEVSVGGIVVFDLDDGSLHVQLGIHIVKVVLLTLNDVVNVDYVVDDDDDSVVVVVVVV
ncbi:hypothetical protein BGZ49_004235, partial [Haplosporangium sp. Z 27]